MPVNRVQDLPYLIAEMLDSMYRRIAIAPIWLGGGSGAGGGEGERPGGFIGKLIQRRVTFDTTESNATSAGSDPSLVHNLNRIRAHLAPQAHAVTRWRAPAGTLNLELPDLWEAADQVSVNGFPIDPIRWSLSEDRGRIEFGEALNNDAIVIAEGTLLRL